MKALARTTLGRDRVRTNYRTKRYHSAAGGEPHYRWSSSYISTCAGFGSAFRDADLPAAVACPRCGRGCGSHAAQSAPFSRQPSCATRIVGRNISMPRSTNSVRTPQVLIAQHHWPVWGNERVRARLANQRDLYKYVHDQTIRMMNQGLGPTEIAEDPYEPPGLENDWSAREYYGTISNNSRPSISALCRLVTTEILRLSIACRASKRQRNISSIGGRDRRG